MTKDEADERVKATKERLADEILRMRAKGNAAIRLDIDAVGDALVACQEAEAARAALDKPRLMTLEDARRVYTQATSISADGWTFHSNKGVQAILEAVRADILAQAEKLPQYGIERPAGGIASGFGRAFGMTAVVNEPAILLSDLRNLIQGT